MEVYTHRCRGFNYKDHSVRALRAALQSPVHGIEVDVRLTKDLKWVVIHDPFYKDEQNQVRRVHEHKFSSMRRELEPLDTILSLFAALGEGKKLFIDVKDVGEERQLVKMIKNHNVEDRTIIIAWEPEVLKRVHKIAPELKLGLSYVPMHEKTAAARGVTHKPRSRHGVLLRFNELHSFDTGLSLGKTHQHYLSELPDLPLYSVQVFSLFCSSKLVQNAHTRGLKVIAFTVNNRLSFSLLRKRGVDGVLTNTPLLFAR